MANKDKAIYAPGELDRVRNNLGVVDKDEARRMTEKLGGEVGYERDPIKEQQANRARQGKAAGKAGKRPGVSPPRQRVELAGDAPEENTGRELRKKNLDPDDDPSVTLKPSYWDRLKIDKYAALPEFEIKSSSQMLFSMLSVFGDPPDLVSPVFVTRRMGEYYKKIETMVVSTRSLFPRNNLLRNERMKKSAPMAFAILDVIRYCNIERISGDLAKLQSHPKNVKVRDFIDILKAIYRPLFIVERLDMEAHIRAAYKILYKALYVENPMEAQEKYQPLIRTALASFAEFHRDVRYLLYPLLLKIISAKWVSYNRFFVERRNRIMAFLNVKEEDQLDPAIAVQDQKNDAEEASSGKPEDSAETEKEPPELTEEERAKKNVEEAERKALDRGIHTLELLFPKAGWDKLSGYPDLYPYFVDMLDLKKGMVNIAPTDPMQQVFILMRIIEELMFALRYVSFGMATTPDGAPHNINDDLMYIINNWHSFLAVCYDKDYLPRLLEYVRILEGSPEEKNSQYTKKLVSDLHWIKRLYLLPYYKFESVTAPSIQKKDATPIYPEIKKLRRLLTIAAAGIEQGNKAGGAESRPHCDGIDNPWDPYAFQVPNPLSRRLDAMLAGKARNNASLVYFTLAVTVVLDHIVNNEESWAYGSRPGPLFRSTNGEGIEPLTGVDARIDADYLFKASLKNRGK